MDIHDLKQTEVLLDQNLGRRHDLKIGDTVSFFGHSFTVAGFTLETMSIGSQYVFLNRKALSRILPGGAFSFTHILIRTDNDEPDETIIDRIQKSKSLSVLSRAELSENMHDFLGMFMLPLLAAGVIMGFLVGSLTIGITLYTAILERFREYCTMKALGATDAYLYGLLLRQSGIALTGGTVLGLPFSVLANHWINQWVPGMTAELDGEILIHNFLAIRILSARMIWNNMFIQGKPAASNLHQPSFERSHHDRQKQNCAAGCTDQRHGPGEEKSGFRKDANRPKAVSHGVPGLIGRWIEGA